MAQKSDKKGSGMARGGGKAGKGLKEEDEEDYGDYVTRCICGYTHDDGFMVQCDGCSVWQHVECITINPNNLPDKYLCEVCQPRPVDRKRARQLQLKKREDISDLEENTKLLSGEGRIDSQKPSPHSSTAKRRRKQSKDNESKPSEAKKSKKEKVEGRRGIRKAGGKMTLTVQGGGKMGSIQSLLNAATLLEGEVEGGKGGGAGSGGWRDLWSADSSPWCDKYDTADHNRYTDPVRQFVSQHLPLLKSEAVVYSQQEYSLMESHTHPQCCVAEAQQRRMGVLAQVEVPEDELVVEYKGKVTVKQAVLADMPPGSKSLWKHKPCPFVYLYDKISGLDLCIDAREYGNLGRFIRRSCSPNAELRHFFVNSEVHFGVYATHTISVREEITLPFDFRYEKCDYPAECACGQKNCPVVRLNRGKRRGRVEGGERGGGYRGGEEREEEQMSGHGRGLGRPHLSLATPPIPQDEDSNSSWTSTGSRKKTRGHTHLPVALPLSVRGEGGSRQTSRDVSSESEEEGGGGGRKKRVKSREDRKAEAVMKMFQRMEASSQRKRRLHTSEGSVDSDSMSPSTLHPAPLTIAYRAQKERRGSTGSRKVHALPPAKMRLSSVSSNEGLSTADLPDAFSPPVTPGFPPDLHSYPSPLLFSPYTLPSPRTHTPSVQVTPYLHPKYLLTEFPLPLKKAILKQWESENHNKSGHTKPHPLWPRDHMTITSGYITTAWAVNNRPRTRGTLKHRWLKQYSEDQAMREDKENKSRNEAGREVPLKKLILLRWQEKAVSSGGDLRPPHTQTPKTTAVSSEKAGTSTSENVPSNPPQGAQDKCQSPLFEEFSDDEFEVVRESGRAGGEREADMKEASGLTESSEGKETEREEGQRAEGAGGLLGDSGRDEGEGQESVSDLNMSNISDVSDVSMESKPCHSQTPPPPAMPQNAVNVSDISSDMDLREDSLEGEEAPPPPPVPSSGPTSMEGGKVVGKEEEEGRGGEREEEGDKDRAVVVSHRAKSLEEVMLESQGRGGMEEEGGRKETRGGKSLEDLLDIAGGGGEFGAEVSQLPVRKQLGVEGREGEGGGGGSLTTSPEMREGQALLGGTPVTPAGSVPGRRKKINLTEYRSRARKPAEQRKESTSSEQSSSPQHTSFLSHSFNPSQLSYSMLLPAAKGVTTSLGVGSSGGVASPVPQPQFEPVSPDDMEPVTSQVVMEASSIPQQPLSLATGGGGGGRVGIPAAHLPPGVMAMSESAMAHQPAAAFIQPGTHSGGQYGMEPLWNAPQMEPAQDPRRHLIGGGGDIYPHGGLLPHPQPHVQAHPPATHVMMSQPGPAPSNSGDLMPHPPDYSTHQPHTPHGYVPARHQHRPMFHPRHPGASGGFY